MLDRKQNWEGLQVKFDKPPIEVRCPWCGAEPGELCYDAVDDAVKRNFHGERAEAAGYGYVVQ